MTYTPEQYEACQPKLKSDAESKAKRSHVGERVEVKATATITADEGYFIDTREGAFTFVNTGGINMGKGTPRVTERAHDMFATELSLTNTAKRGRSLRTGRRALAVASLSGYQLLLTMECISALGALGPMSPEITS